MGEHDETVVQEKVRRWNTGSLMILGAAVVAVIGLGLMTVRAVDVGEQRDVAQEQVSTERDRKQEYVDRALALCDPADPVAVAKLRAVGLCDLAQEDKKSVVAPPAPEVSFSTVLDAVEAYLRANPPKDGKTPSREELLALTEQVYRSAPPKDGVTPSREELLGLVQEVYAANPPANGKDGRDGVDGRDGQQGPGVASLDLVPRDTRCYLVVTFEKYADGRQVPPSEREVDPRLCYTPPESTSPSVVPTS